MNTLIVVSCVAAAFVSASTSLADTLAVFGKDHVAVVQESGAISAASENFAQMRFAQALATHAASGTFQSKLPIEAPPEWGKTVPGSSGMLEYESRFAQGIPLHIGLRGLAPRHLYLLTLNGTPGQPGNTLLADAVQGLPNERFYDFLHIVTDTNGAYDARIGVYLLPGDYRVRVYVKDTDDFKIVLYRDFFDFTVTTDAP